MRVELIPVIEIQSNNVGVETPNKHPYWENQDIWDTYRAESLLKAGFKEKLHPYLKGSPFYQLEKVSKSNLTKVILEHTNEFRNGKYERESSSPLFGGFVLRINDEDKFFPQCCGDLADINFWEKISKGNNSYYEGHPIPKLKFKWNKVILDFTTGIHDEHFEPTPPEIKVTIKLKDLRDAVDRAKQGLGEFEERVKQVNEEQLLKINRIEDLLVWGDNS